MNNTQFLLCRKIFWVMCYEWPVLHSAVKFRQNKRIYRCKAKFNMSVTVTEFSESDKSLKHELV